MGPFEKFVASQQQYVGGGPIVVYDAKRVVAVVRKPAASRQYRDNAVLATLKVLNATGSLRPETESQWRRS